MRHWGWCALGRTGDREKHVDVPFLEAIADGGMVGDGAMGSLLYERGVFVNRNFDEVNLTQPELVYKIHREYLLAGAHLLETNTYGANRIRLSHAGLGDKTSAINSAAVDIAKRVAGGAAYIAGSIGPTGLGPGQVRRAEDEVRRGYAEQARILAEAGSDLLVIETFAHPAELRLAVEAVRSVTDLPIVAQIAVGDGGGVVDATDPVDLAREMADWGADVVGANCNGPQLIHDFAIRMVESGLPVCAFPNAGRPQRIEDRLIYLATPENFGVYARRMFKAGIKMVGGCCGTGPGHITRVGSAARMVSPRLGRPRAVIDAEDTGRPAKPISERSRFGAILGKSFVISVEVNPGPGLNVERPIEAARALVEAGADVINIADGPRATARMGNVALATRLQEALDVDVLLHVCTRDRNLIGLQAHILGAHVLGIRNMVVITGDPPKVGDYPDATAVYDVDSIGLLRIVSGFNRGVDPSGKSMAEQTEIVLASGVEPAAQDFEREMVRFHQKIESGASVIMTQPIYEPETLQRFLEASEDVDIPIMVGILPLASYRNAEFIHNHIPGMSVPENIRDRMRQAGKGDAARAEGVAIAVETLLAIRDRVAGAYIMPPLGRYEMAAQIIEAIGSDRGLAERVPGRVA